MSRKTIAYGAAAIALLVATYVGLDALIVTDEERLLEFADAIMGDVTPETIDAGFHWIDTSRQPVEVFMLGESRLYEDDAELRQRARQGMSRFMGQRLSPLSRGVNVEDDRGTVTLRVMNQTLGMVRATFDFRKRGDDWLIEKATFSRG